MNRFSVLPPKGTNYYALTLGQTDTSRAGDQVDQLCAALTDIPVIRGFSRTLGDEAQGILSSAHDVIEASMRALRMGRWRVGIGVGSLHEPLPESLADVEGHALVFTRRAVNKAAKVRSRCPLAVAGPMREVAADAQAVLRMVGTLVRDRSTAQWRVLDLLTPGVRGQQQAIADALGISKQAVSSTIVRSSWDEEWAGRKAAARLLEQIA